MTNAKSYLSLREEKHLFRLKQFALAQDRTAMKVGTDALALGSWVASLELPVPQHILDVGTGTGVLALMLAQRYPSAHIDAVEIDAGALLDARDNILSSPWADRISLVEGDFLLYQPALSYDLIISNPPYFASSSLSSPRSQRTLARRESMGGLGLSSLLSRGRELLSPRGYLCLVCPPDRLTEVRLVATESLLSITHLCEVSSVAREVVRYLVALQPLAISDSYRPCQSMRLDLRDADGQMSAEYRLLTRDYLLD